MLVSEKNRMKVHKTQWLQAVPYSPECLSGATSRGRTMAPEAQMPAQCPDRGQLSEMWTYKFLRTKHFHGVSSASPHIYSLKSRIGKARSYRFMRMPSSGPRWVAVER